MKMNVHYVNLTDKLYHNVIARMAFMKKKINAIVLYSIYLILYRMLKIMLEMH